MLLTQWCHASGSNKPAKTELVSSVGRKYRDEYQFIVVVTWRNFFKIMKIVI